MDWTPFSLGQDLSPDLRVEGQTMWPPALSKLLVSSSLGFRWPCRHYLQSLLSASFCFFFQSQCAFSIIYLVLSLQLCGELLVYNFSIFYIHRLSKTKKSAIFIWTSKGGYYHKTLIYIICFKTHFRLSFSYWQCIGYHLLNGYALNNLKLLFNNSVKHMYIA